jgi:hypothetical protein
MHNDDDANESRQDENYQAFRDCVFSAIIEKLSTPQVTKKKSTARARRKSASSSTRGPQDDQANAAAGNIAASSIPTDDPADLADFAEYLASEIFTSLPSCLQTLNHTTVLPDHFALPLTTHQIEAHISPHLPPSTAQNLSAYGLVQPPATDTTTFLHPILNAYTSTATTPPPPPSQTRPETNECELCARTHLPLTYHHLIPRSIHAKALKRGWHDEAALNSVAWLCRACHSWVHRTIGNEELAKEWYTVERLQSREDCERWVKWVGGVRWKKR